MVKRAKVQPSKAAAGISPRVRELTRKQVRAKGRKETAKKTPIPGSFNLLKRVFGIFKHFWKPLGGIVLVYLALNIVFASDLLSNLNNSVSGIRQSHHLSDAWSGYTSLLSQNGSNTNQQAGSSLTQSVLLVLESLVIIWALRQLLAGEKIRVKQAYYRSMGPLVPFILVILVILIQLLPASLGAAILAIVATSSVGGLATFISAVVFVALAGWSIYMVCSSIFGLYIVTLPDMQPRQALRSAKNLVSYRRWLLLRRLLFLPVFILAVMGLITVLTILIVPILAVPVFFIMIMLAVLFVHTYLYSLYRGLIE